MTKKKETNMVKESLDTSKEVGLLLGGFIGKVLGYLLFIIMAAGIYITYAFYWIGVKIMKFMDKKL